MSADTDTDTATATATEPGKNEESLTDLKQDVVKVTTETVPEKSDLEANLTKEDVDDVEVQDAMDVEHYLDFIVPKTDDPSTPAFT
jgi:hypothetical protein